MCETAEKSHVLDDEKVSGDFARASERTAA
jgi:hypothetical protein